MPLDEPPVGDVDAWAHPRPAPSYFLAVLVYFTILPDYYSQYRYCWWWSDTPDSLLLHLQKRNKQMIKNDKIENSNPSGDWRAL